ncbi:MAG TPA: glycosyltransferase [Candidatus Dormibacteraeota bacterium]|jgi:glycosyltransferase involved in cell wall biosynthesis|nr:glycosyltransferase [Candidatus Dormibacteraeota bacterium]
MNRELSVIVPAYREGARIHDNLRHLIEELEPLGLDYEVLVVSDGNQDDTVAEAERVGSPRVRVLAYEVNMGKGFALGYGVRHSEGELVTFIDADMELHPKEIRAFIEILKAGDHQVVVGSKRHPSSQVHYPLLRRLQSRAYQLLISVLFDLAVTDTQTGLKLFRREVLMDVVPRLAVKRFAFDLELLAVAHHRGFRRVAEAPVHLDYQFSSTVNLRSAFRALWDTMAIFYRLRILRYYDRAPGTWPAPELRGQGGPDRPR